MIPFAFFQGQELLIIAVIVLVLFGGSQIPKLMKGLGKGVGEFKKGVDESKKILEETKEEIRKD